MMIKESLQYHQEKNEYRFLASIQEFVEQYWNFQLVTKTVIANKKTKWHELKFLGNFYSILLDYSEDDYYTKEELFDYASRCMARAFMLSPYNEKHSIVFDFNNLVEKTYKQYTACGDNQVTYGSSLVMYLHLVFFFYKQEYPSVIKKWSHRTREHRLANLLQMYLCKHLIAYNKIKQDYFFVNYEKVDKYENNLKGLTMPEINFVAKDVLEKIFLRVTDEAIQDEFNYEEYWEYDKRHNYVKLVNTYEEEFNRDQEGNTNNYYNENYEDDIYNGYGKYKGSYAQDVMGYSDDDIDTIFDGDPDAYWNID